MVLPFISIADTYNFDVVTLQESDDQGSDEIVLTDTLFPFGDITQSSIYVSNIITFLVLVFIMVRIIDWDKWTNFIWKLLQQLSEPDVSRECV